jgi:hypothetical protein
VKIFIIIVFTFFSSHVNAYCQVESNGGVYCSDKGYVGEVESDGSIYSYKNGYTGVVVEDNGDIYDYRGGGYTGVEVEDNGDVYDYKNGNGSNLDSSWIDG